MAKVTAFTCGARNGNCEILVKEALMTLEKLGHQVEMIRLNDCDLRVCKGCPNGPCGDKGPGAGRESGLRPGPPRGGLDPQASGRRGQ